MNIRHLQSLVLIDKVLKYLHEEKETAIKETFSYLVGPMVWEHIKDSFCTSYDFDDDLYIIFSCPNRYREDVNKKLQDVFGASFDYGSGDNYVEYQISSAYIHTLR